VAVPDYQALMLPVMRLAGAGAPVRVRDAAATISEQLNLTPEDRAEIIPSGQQKILNRVHWAVSYLAHAGLLVRPSRGRFAITERGTAVLKAQPLRIDNVFLQQFPEFLAFRPKSGGSPARKAANTPTGHEPPEMTPDEMVEEGYERLRKDTEAALLERLLAGTPEFFEQAVVDLLVAMRFGGTHHDAARRIGQTGDGGIDGVIDEDALGLDAVYIQAKRWKNNVGAPELQGFIGSLIGKKATKGVFLTTSSFTSQARKYVEGISHRVVLIDGAELAHLMFERGVGVRTRRTFEVKDVDTGYFEVD
jgi:restriction system protein